MAESSTNGKEKRNKSKESSARCWSKVEQSSQSTSSKSRTFNATSSDPDNMDGLRERMSVFWPAEFLPEDFRKTRILSWGYESNVSGFFTGPVNKNSYHAHARDLLYDLNQERTESVSGNHIISRFEESLSLDREVAQSFGLRIPSVASSSKRFEPCHCSPSHSHNNRFLCVRILPIMMILPYHWTIFITRRRLSFS